MANGTTILTIPEAIEVLRISRSSMYAIMGRGDLKTVKFGKSRRVRLTDLERYIERCAGEKARPPSDGDGLEPA